MASQVSDGEEVVKGRCNCGEVEIEIRRGAWPGACGLCHCLCCKASSGSLFSVNLRIGVGDVTVLGKPKVFKDRDSESGNTVERWFCGDCGSAIMSVVVENPDLAYVKGGMFAKTGVELPVAGAHVWWRRKEKWEVAEEGVRVVE